MEQLYFMNNLIGCDFDQKKYQMRFISIFLHVNYIINAKNMLQMKCLAYKDTDMHW